MVCFVWIEPLAQVSRYGERGFLKTITTMYSPSRNTKRRPSSNLSAVIHKEGVYPPVTPTRGVEPHLCILKPAYVSSTNALPSHLEMPGFSEQNFKLNYIEPEPFKKWPCDRDMTDP